MGVGEGVGEASGSVWRSGSASPWGSASVSVSRSASGRGRRRRRGAGSPAAPSGSASRSRSASGTRSASAVGSCVRRRRSVVVRPRRRDGRRRREGDVVDVGRGLVEVVPDEHRDPDRGVARPRHPVVGRAPGTAGCARTRSRRGTVARPWRSRPPTTACRCSAAIEVATWPLENMRPSMSTTTSPVARTPPLTRIGCGVPALKLPGRLAAAATRPSEPVTYWMTRRLVPSYTSRADGPAAMDHLLARDADVRLDPRGEVMLQRNRSRRHEQPAAVEAQRVDPNVPAPTPAEPRRS